MADTEVATSPTPKKATKVKENKVFNFFDALKIVKDGGKITRLEWESGYFLLMQDSYLKIHKPDDTYHALLVRDGDMLAEDWIEIK